MGAIKDRLCRVLNSVQDTGAADKAARRGHLTDQRLWAAARAVDPELFTDGEVDQDVVGQLREAYDEGYKPQMIDLRHLAGTLNGWGVGAEVRYDVGGAHLLHVGPSFPDGEGVPRAAVTAGPGFLYRGGVIVADVDEFSYGTGDPAVPDGQRIIESLDDVTRDVEEIAWFILDVLRREMRRRQYGPQVDHDQQVLERVSRVVEQAELAVGEVFAEAFQEITTGDIHPGVAQALENAIRAAVEALVQGNEPKRLFWTQPATGR